MTTLAVILIALWLALILIAWTARAVTPQGPYAGDRLAVSLAQLSTKVYARLVHRLKIDGLHHADAAWAAAQATKRPLLLISNHKAGVDGALISAAMPMFVRWMMAADMKHDTFEHAYRFAQVIFVCRENGPDGPSRDMAGVRAALRHLAAGGCVGIFPEGRLCRHPGQIYPFQPGAGLLISRARPIVLPIVVRTASIQPTAYASLYRLSNSRLEVMPAIDFGAPASAPAAALRPAQIVRDLQARYEQWVGPVNPEPPLPTGKD